MSTGAHVSDSDVMVVLVRHRAFVKGDARGVKADFSFKDISGVSLQKEQLNGVTFRGANLAKSHLRHCSLVGTDFFGADLEGADLTGSNLTGADFRGANLHRATLSNTNLRNADFRISSGHNGDPGRSTSLNEAKIDHAILCEANLTDCDMSGADLVDADLSGADLTQTVLLGADLSGASLTDARMSNTVLELSRLTDKQIGQIGTTDGIAAPTYRTLPHDEIVKMFNDHGRWIVTGGAKGKRLDIIGADLTGVKILIKSLAGARLRKCNLTSLSLKNVIFDMADLSYSCFAKASFDQSSFRGANFRSSDLSMASIRNAKFDPMPLESNRHWSTNFDQAVLRGADLSGASFTNSVMNKTDICGCKLDGATFVGVDLTTLKKDQTANICSEPEKRIFQRYSEPQLFVKIEHGVFPTVNWSVGGVCMKYEYDDRLEVGADIWGSIVSKEIPTPMQTQFTVIRDVPEKGHVYMRFSCISEDVKNYIESLAAKSVDLHKERIAQHRRSHTK